MTTQTKPARFAASIRSGTPQVVPGAYDALSAIMVERAGFDAVYVGSFATAASSLGLPDVGVLTINDIAEHVERISNSTTIPVLADGEAGFFEPANMWRTVSKFERSGAVGIHIEDNLGGKHSAMPAGLASIASMSAKIQAAVEAKTDPDFQIIARTDAVWVYGDPEDARIRLREYVQAGADAVFVPGVSVKQLEAIRKAIAVPITVLGDLPESGETVPPFSIQDLTDAGADLVVLFYLTLGAAAFGVQRVLNEIVAHADARLVADLVEAPAHFEARLGYGDYEARAKRYQGGTNA